MFQEKGIGKKIWTEISEKDMREKMSRFTNPMAGMTVDYFVDDLLKGGTRQAGGYYYRFWPEGKAGNPSQ